MTDRAATHPVTGIAASYYMTKDLPAAIAFYDALLGTTPAAHAPDAYAEYVLGDGAAFGLYKSSSFYAGGTVLFEVADVAAVVAAAAADGATTFGGGHVEDTPSCLMAFGTDPDGNQFILHQKK